MPLLLEACPSFRETRDAAPDAEGLLYVELGNFTRHLVALIQRGSTSELPATFDVVERLLVKGDAQVKEAATIGLLEGIQNAALNGGVPLEPIAAHLKPESHKSWVGLLRFWNG